MDLEETQTYIYFQKATSVLRYYKGDFKAALLHLFPNIGLDPSKFT